MYSSRIIIVDVLRTEKSKKKADPRFPVDLTDARGTFRQRFFKEVLFVYTGILLHVFSRLYSRLQFIDRNTTYYTQIEVSDDSEIADGKQLERKKRRFYKRRSPDDS